MKSTSNPATGAAIDLFALRYLALYLSDDLMAFIIEERINKKSSLALATKHLWERFVNTDRPRTPEIDLYIYDGQTFAPAVPNPVNQRIDYRFNDETASGKRRYLFQHEFFYRHRDSGCIVGREAVEDILAQLWNY